MIKWPHTLQPNTAEVSPVSEGTRWSCWSVLVVHRVQVVPLQCIMCGWMASVVIATFSVCQYINCTIYLRVTYFKDIKFWEYFVNVFEDEQTVCNRTSWSYDFEVKNYRVSVKSLKFCILKSKSPYGTLLVYQLCSIC